MIPEHGSLVQKLFPYIEYTTSIAIIVAPSDYAIDFLCFPCISGHIPVGILSVTVRTGVPVTFRIIRSFRTRFIVFLRIIRSFRTAAFQDCLRRHTVSFCLIQHIQECFVHSCIQRAVDLPALEHSSILADCRKRFIHLLQGIAPLSDSMIKCNRSLSAV